jgi:hypothetical protein
VTVAAYTKALPAENMVWQTFRGFLWGDPMLTHKSPSRKPTGCTFTPYPGQSMSGNMRMGELGNKLPSGEDYRPEDVKAMMQQLWEKHCATNK